MKKENVRAWGWIVAVLYTLLMVTVGDVNAVQEEEVPLTKEEVRQKEKIEALSFYSETIGIYDKNGLEVVNSPEEIEKVIDTENIDGVIVLDESVETGKKLRVAFEITVPQMFEDDVSLDDLKLGDNLIVLADDRKVEFYQSEVVSYKDGILVMEAVAQADEYLSPYTVTPTELKLHAKDDSVKHLKNKDKQFMFGNSAEGNFKESYEFEEWVWE